MLQTAVVTNFPAKHGSFEECKKSVMFTLSNYSNPEVRSLFKLILTEMQTFPEKDVFHLSVG